MRSAINTLIIAIAGCAVIILFVPFVKLFAVQYELNRASEDMGNGHPEAAVKRLERFEPWDQRTYPALAGKVSCEIIRCYTRMNDLATAEKRADRMYQRKTAAEPPRFPEGADDLRALLEDGPDRLAVIVAGCVRDGAFDCNPSAGYDVILFELEIAGKHTELEACARRILGKAPGHAEAQDVIAFLETGTKPEREVPGSLPPPPPGASRQTHEPPEDIPAEPAQEDEEAVSSVDQQPSPSVEETRGTKAEELREREAQLVAQIKERRQYLAAHPPPPGPAQQKYEAALQEYQALVDKSKTVQKEWEKSTGPKRSQLMDELRKMKGEILRSENQVRWARDEVLTSKEGEAAKAENDPMLLDLDKELMQVRHELESL